jgi:hypothetical protein
MRHGEGGRVIKTWPRKILGIYIPARLSKPALGEDRGET